MTDAAVNGAYEHVPTRWERLVRWLGYRFHLGEEPEEMLKAHTGWMKTELKLHFSVADRLRLLVTGQLYVGVTSYVITEGPVTLGLVRNRVDWMIQPPKREKLNA